MSTLFLSLSLFVTLHSCQTRKEQNNTAKNKILSNAASIPKIPPKKPISGSSLIVSSLKVKKKSVGDQEAAVLSIKGSDKSDYFTVHTCIDANCKTIKTSRKMLLLQHLGVGVNKIEVRACVERTLDSNCGKTKTIHYQLESTMTGETLKLVKQRLALSEQIKSQAARIPLALTKYQEQAPRPTNKSEAQFDTLVQNYLNGNQTELAERFDSPDYASLSEIDKISQNKLNLTEEACLKDLRTLNTCLNEDWLNIVTYYPEYSKQIAEFCQTKESGCTETQMINFIKKIHTEYLTAEKDEEDQESRSRKKRGITLLCLGLFGVGGLAGGIGGGIAGAILGAPFGMRAAGSSATVFAYLGTIAAGLTFIIVGAMDIDATTLSQGTLPKRLALENELSKIRGDIDPLAAQASEIDKQLEMIAKR